MGASSANSALAANIQSGRDRAPPLGILLLPAVLLLAWGIAGFWYDPESFRALLGGRVGGDFTNRWTAARMVLAGDISPLHDISAYRAEQVALFGFDYPPHNWSYPPHLLLLVWPLGLLIPLVGLAGGHWRVFISAALGGMALVGASVLVFGWQI